ncbi:MAG: beta-ketoacyl synthase N-terminal-like domain-containing protein [Myxococcales bacterium]|nr:beta-ketoacyl synthase N-terminal-like domain-containing protein [Myxococcales bacterium]
MASGESSESLVAVLQRHAAERVDEVAYVFLADGERVQREVTFGELERMATRTGAELVSRGLRGTPILLLCPAGIEYLGALLGCLYGGCIAVPAYPPVAHALARAVERVGDIARDCRAAAILSTPATARLLDDVPGDLARLERILVDRAHGVSPQAAVSAPASTDPAILQYTSGSTSTPRGVVITHGNLLANLRLMQHATGHAPEETMVSWLPPYHDMGLIGALLTPLHAGARCVTMPTEAFLRRPQRWLRAVTDHRASMTVAPNFAYELCRRRIRPEQRDGLDLSSLRIVSCGAEPLNAETLEGFAREFAAHGFRRSAFHPCYGLAEATLMVSGGVTGRGPVVRAYDARQLEQGVAEGHPGDAQRFGTSAPSRPLVGCGRAQPGEQIRIVDPQTRREAGPGRVGEVWVQGPSVARGYWNRPRETAEVFGARIADSGDGPFLRTGDLGFFDRGELFITGRLKDLIIVRGLNHYPQDIERTVQGVHEALLPDSGAAFAVAGDGSEELVVVQEVHRSIAPPLDALIEQIAETIREAHDLAATSVVLIRKGSALKTASGKIQRRAMRQAFLDDELVVMRRWSTRRARPPDATEAPRARTSTPSIRPPPPTQPIQQTAPPSEPTIDPRLTTYQTESSPAVPGSEPPAPATYTRPVSHRREQIIAEYLRERLAARTGKPLAEIEPTAPLAHYGVDSLVAAELLDELEGWLEIELPATISYDNPTIVSLARALARAEAGQTTRPQRPTPLLAQAASAHDDPIAIVGMACRFPGAATLEGFWDVLRHGVDATGELPHGRWNARALVDPAPATPGKMVTSRGGYVEGIDLFDAPFFEISAHEAARMDPQQRLFLEVCWEALEDAGQSPAALAETDTGVFAAVSTNDYAILYGGDLSLVDVDYGTGNSPSVVANRVSYFLDLKGPSETVDAACASSLVALQHASQALRGHDCEVALVGGVNAVLAPEGSVYFSQLRALSPAGRCRSFDAAADGFVRSEGCGVVVLKRLSRATADGDRVYALVAGSAVNHDGKSNGMLAPNGLAQQKVVRKALRAAGIGSDDLDYVEAHGVGTPVADMVELRSLGAALEERSPDRPLLVGSVKTNLGHLEAASGMAGLIKTALALHHENIPPHLHLRDVHPDIRIEQLPLEIPTAAAPWKRGARPRFAGVSTFGFGGTNAHAVLREAPLQTPLPSENERSSHLFTLSARSEPALRTLAARTASRLADQPVGDIAYTANVGRSHLAHRVAIHFSTVDALRASLEQLAAGATNPQTQRGRVEPGHHSSVALVFPDLTPHSGGAYALYDAHPEFRQALLHCDALLQPILPRPLLSVLYGTDLRLSRELLASPSYRRACTVSLQYALHVVLSGLGLEPAAVHGAGAGEYAAAAASGVLSWEQAVVLAARSGLVIEGLQAPGARRLSLRELKAALAEVDYLGPSVPLVLASQGRAFNLDELPGADHWVRELYRPPGQEQGHDALARERCDLHLVVGPGGAPPAVADDLPAITPERWLGAMSLGGRRDGSLDALLRAIARLHVGGVPIDWLAFDRPYPRRKVSLPSYPFERTRHWLDFPSRASTAREEELERRSDHPLISRMRVRRQSPGGLHTQPDLAEETDEDEGTGS